MVNVAVSNCRDGAGRTGSYIALDLILITLKQKGVTDILNTVRMLRKFRPCMVNHVVGDLILPAEELAY